jgi:hypothetical protein
MSLERFLAASEAFRHRVVQTPTADQLARMTSVERFAALSLARR